MQKQLKGFGEKGLENAEDESQPFSATLFGASSNSKKDEDADLPMTLRYADEHEREAV